MASLDSLRELCAWMREAHVSYARCGELELRIEAMPLPAPPAPPPAEADPEEEERQALADTLYSSGIGNEEVEAILAMRRRDPS